LQAQGEPLNIYIEVEIRARELERALLLGLLAAARGHRVLVGRLKGRIASGKIPVKPGIYHAKSIGGDLSTRRLLEDLTGRGFVVTSQDEEHGLIAEDYAPFARTRFSETTLSQTERVFCWGNQDQEALRLAYPKHYDRFVKTGSARVDLWRPDHAAYYENVPLTGVDLTRPLVLFVSNVAGPINTNDLATLVRSKRYSQGELDTSSVVRMIASSAYKTSMLAHLVQAVHHVASMSDDIQLVVRPHPVERWGAWNDLLGLHDNVLVTRQHSIGPWLKAASVVVQNGCTSAFEAAVGQRPLISHIPEDLGTALPPNQLGVRTHDLDELEFGIRDAINGNLAPSGCTPEERRLLDFRFAALQGPLAAERIVDSWEELDRPGLSETWSVRAVQALAEAWAMKNRADPRRSAAGGSGIASPHGSSWRDNNGELSTHPFVTEHKFQPIRRHEVNDFLRRFSRIGVRTDNVFARPLGPDMVRIETR